MRTIQRRHTCTRPNADGSPVDYVQVFMRVLGDVYPTLAPGKRYRLGAYSCQVFYFGTRRPWLTPALLRSVFCGGTVTFSANMVLIFRRTNRRAWRPVAAIHDADTVFGRLIAAGL